MKKSDTRFIVYLVKILKGVWFEKKCGVFSIYFQLFVGPTTKNTSLVVFCTQFSFSAFKKQHTMFGRFHFLENEYRGIFVKKTNFMGPTNSKLSYQKLSLSQWWWWSIDESDPWLMLTGSGLFLGVVVFLWIGLLKWLWWLFVLRHI